jgi:SSS family solute:Na+ symporter
MHTTLHALDVAIIALYLGALAAVGIHFSRRQKNLDRFFLARQSMAWLPVGLSLMAALDSAIDYLMQPSATIRYGLILLIGTSSWLFLYPWVSKVTLPFYRRLNYYTAYEYLEPSTCRASRSARQQATGFPCGCSSSAWARS